MAGGIRIRIQKRVHPLGTGHVAPEEEEEAFESVEGGDGGRSGGVGTDGQADKNLIRGKEG